MGYASKLIDNAIFFVIVLRINLEFIRKFR